MAWLNPGALVALGAVAVPLLVHLLLRRRATRVAFPTVRFITPNPQSAVRPRRPSDILLLLVRAAIVSFAALAVARPLLLTNARRDAWMRRTVRAIVVDASPSVSAKAAGETAAAEARGASVSRRFDSATPGDALKDASAWLSHAETGVREIVVVSDFQRGTLSAADVQGVGEEIGLRMVRLATSVRVDAALDAGAVLHAGDAYRQSIVLDGHVTRVTLRPIAHPSGLEIAGAVQAAAAERLRRAVSEAGAVAPSTDQPIHIRLGSGAAGGGSQPLDGWMREAVVRLLASPAAENVRIHPARQDQALLLNVGAPVDSIAAAFVVQAALNARRDPRALAEHEPEQIPSTVLASWTRKPAPPGPGAWRQSTQSDGRWLWLGAIVLMGVESLLRRERAARPAAEEAHAA